MTNFFDKNLHKMEKKQSPFWHTLSESIDSLTTTYNSLSTHLVEKFVSAFCECKGKAIFLGIGKSGDIAKKITHTLSSTGTPSFFLHPTEARHGDLGVISPDDLVVMISNSGETEELIQLIPFFKSNGNTLLAITHRPTSSLGKNAYAVLPLLYEKEACPYNLAPTTSTLLTLALGDALAMELMERKKFKPDDFARIHPAGGLGKRLLLKVKDVMRTDSLPILGAKGSFSQLIEKMTYGKLGLAILGEESSGENNFFKVTGLITDGDLRRFLQNSSSLHHLDKFEAQQIATLTPQLISEETSLQKALEIFLQKKITSLIVADKHSFLKGVLQIYDLP